jgi:uncharacterized protein with NAD-binding domain and iron-sulfur cluster
MAPLRKIAILGGGMGSLAAAMDLTSRPGWQDAYEIHVYQMGWRLGGKCASARDPARNFRIEEHGAHLWFGFYENAFALLRQVYGELNRPAGATLQTWTDAMKPHHEFTVEERVADGWRDWTIALPELPGTPGDGDVLTTWHLLLSLFGFLVRHFEEAVNDVARAGAAVEATARWAARVRASGAHVDTRLHRAHAMAQTLSHDVAEHTEQDYLTLHHHLSDFRRWLAAEVADDIASGDDTRRFWMTMDLGLTTLIGLFRDRVLLEGFPSIDGEDWQQWMDRHGLAPEHRYCAPVRLIYDTVFAYRDGQPDAAHADLAAGVAIHGALRLIFGYKGAVFFEMQAGMGDTVIAPFYLVLRNRGVNFHFFHRVDRLVPDASGGIGSIEMTRQVPGADEGYEPLIVTPDGLPVWPPAPLCPGLPDDVNLESRRPGSWDAHMRPLILTRGRDFDVVLLGISAGALPAMAAELAAAAGPGGDAWRTMVTTLRTVATQSTQLWLKDARGALGWSGTPARSGSQAPVVGSFAEPFSTWADFSHLIAREQWTGPSAPNSCAYLFGVIGDSTAWDADRLGEVKANVRAFLQSQAPYLWPSICGADGVRLDALSAPPGATGEACFDDQWFRVNGEGSERYALSVAGSTKNRLPPGESGFDNLFVAGDWTATALNVGCVEAAVMSGRLASRAICGLPEHIPGEHGMDRAGIVRRTIARAVDAIEGLFGDRGPGG